MQDSIFVVGHRNPDTDSICAAVAYAELKRRQGISAVAARAGEISRETAFVLERFGLPCPPLLETVRTQVCDLALDPVTPISPDSSIKTAWTLIKKHNIRMVHEVESNEKRKNVQTISFDDVKFLSRKGQPSDEVAFITDAMTENELREKLGDANVINIIKVTNY